MDYEEIFDQSFERCKACSQEPSFFTHFYNNFKSSDPRVVEAFKGTDMGHQQRMLERSFYRLLVFYATNSADAYIENIAIKHNRRHANIEPELYDLWLEKLIESVAEYDPQFDSSVELAWRLVMATGITYMKFMYDHSNGNG